MLHFIYNLYYRVYKFIKSLSEESAPRYNAVLVMSILLMLNFITIIVLLISISRKIIIVNLPKGYLFAAGLLIIAINSYLIFGKKHYLEIEAKFENEETKSRIKNNLKAATYVALTILLLIISLVYLNNYPIIEHN